MQLLINEIQAGTIMRALEFYFRIGLGQFEQLARLFELESTGRLAAFDAEVIHDGLMQLKMQILALPRNASYGLSCPKLPEDYRTAYDIFQVIRHFLAWQDNPAGTTGIGFFGPQQLGQERLPQIIPAQ